MRIEGLYLRETKWMQAGCEALSPHLFLVPTTMAHGNGKQCEGVRFRAMFGGSVAQQDSERPLLPLVLWEQSDCYRGIPAIWSSRV